MVAFESIENGFCLGGGFVLKHHANAMDASSTNGIQKRLSASMSALSEMPASRLPRRNALSAALTSRKGARGAPGAGTSCAIGTPCLVIVMVLPCDSSSSKRGKCVLAS
jgi:hypothetical protein